MNSEYFYNFTKTVFKLLVLLHQEEKLLLLKLRTKTEKYVTVSYYFQMLLLSTAVLVEGTLIALILWFGFHCIR